MVADEDFQLDVHRPDPVVWVERLVIFSQVEPLTVIRNVPLARGLNIVWAAETEEDAAGPTDVVGHSAGKTTFCRLLRYCLGEAGFGTADAQPRIRHNFPDGYVGASVWVSGQKWSVARPIGSGNRHYAAPGIEVEELLTARKVANEYEKFIAAVSDAVIKPLKVKQNPRTGQTLEWRHVLAWCARDQEARYQDFWDWRAQRSAAEPLGFPKPKGDAIFIMRVLLGMVAGDEAKAVRELASKETARDALRVDVAEAQREPTYWDRELTKRVTLVLNAPVALPLDLGEGLFDQDCLAHRAIEYRRAAEGEIGKLDHNLDALETEGERLQRDRHEWVRDLNDCMNALAQENKELSELTAGREEAAKDEQLPEPNPFWECPYGRRALKNVECWGLYEERRKRHRSLVFATAAAEVRDDAARTQHAKAVEALRAEVAELTRQASEARKKLDEWRIRRGQARTAREQLTRSVDSVDDDLTRLREWRSVLAGNRPNEKLDDLHKRLSVVETAVAVAQEAVRQLVASHKRSRQQFGELFNRAIRAVLTKAYAGAMVVNEDELYFKITHGPPLGGEAITTLAIVLGDLVALMSSVEGRAHLPGLLVHDSPREADLGRMIYWNVIRFAQRLSQLTSPAPFQYIITTTTSPPPGLRENPPVRLPLDASKPTELLFGKVLEAADDELPGIRSVDSQ